MTKLDVMDWALLAVLVINNVAPLLARRWPRLAQALLAVPSVVGALRAAGMRPAVMPLELPTASVRAATLQKGGDA